MHSDVRLRLEQELVANRAFEAFTAEGKDRVQVRAACGMGKTMMEQTAILKYDDHLQETEGRSGNYLFIVPSVSLANQMASDLQNDGVIQGIEYDEKNPANSDILVVHNESKQFAGAANKEDAHHQIVADFMSDGDESDSPRVVIAVVNSIDKVAQGQKRSEVDFDIAMMDEAHNYSSTMNKEKGTKPALPIFFNEQKDSIQSNNRMFFTATPKMKSKTERHDSLIRGGFGSNDTTDPKNKSLKDKIVDLSNSGRKTKVELEVFQDGNSPEVFGEHIGNWGYRHAIMSGYLTKAEFHSNVVTGQGRDELEARNFTRETRVDALGVATSNPNAMSFGSYVSMRSIADSIASQGSRNVLSFMDRIDECEESKRNWEQYLMDLAAASNNGQRFRNDDEARMAVISGSPERKLAGKYHLMAKHAAVTYSSSKSTQQEKEDAENFFDSEAIGDRAPCKCGKPGGWCACARIVHNVDMFSEGISIKSIDTVILNRPSYSSDSSINQAIGRASRKMNGKKIGKVIIPRAAAKLQGDETSGWARPVEDKAYLKATRAIHRIWNDVDGNYIEGNNAPSDTYAEPLSLHDMSDSKCAPWLRPQENMAYEADNVSNQIYGSMEGNAIVAMVWDSALNKASSEWRKSNPDNPFSDLSLQEQQSLARAQRLEVAESLMKNLKPSQIKQAIDILDYRDIDDYKAAKLHLENNDERASAGEFGYTIKQKPDHLIAQAKNPWIRNPVVASRSGFSKDEWDNLYASLFSG